MIEYRGQKITTRRVRDNAYGLRFQARVNGEFVWTYPTYDHAVSQTKLDIDAALERPDAYPWVRP